MGEVELSAAVRGAIGRPRGSVLNSIEVEAGTARALNAGEARARGRSGRDDRVGGVGRVEDAIGRIPMGNTKG